MQFQRCETVVNITTGARSRVSKAHARELVEAGTHEYANAYRNRMLTSR